MLSAWLDVDPVWLARLVGIGLGVSLLVAVLQGSLRQAIWSLWHLVATCFAFLARVTLTFVNLLGRLIDEGIDGLAAEGLEPGAEPRVRPWVGWLIIGPLVYCALMLTFMASDLTVAILIFEAMGLTLGTAVRSSIPIPLDGAMGVVFVALAVFWGIVFFDVLGVTPFEHIWKRLTPVHRRRLVRVVLGCLGVTLLAATAMGLWSQAQLRGGLPEPWQTLLPWFIRASLVALLIGATALSGKPFGSALTAAFVLALLVVRSVAFVVLVILRLMVALLRESMWLPLALVTLVAVIAHSLWNWLAGFDWARRLRIGRLTWPALGRVGGDGETPETFLRPAAADLERNRSATRRLYADLLLEPTARLEEVVAPEVVHHDVQFGTVVGLWYLQQMAAQLRATYAEARIDVESQIAEGDSVVSRFTLRGLQDGRPVAVPGIDTARLRDGRIVERWGLLGAPHPEQAAPKVSGDAQMAGAR